MTSQPKPGSFIQFTDEFLKEEERRRTQRLVKDWKPSTKIDWMPKDLDAKPNEKGLGVTWTKEEFRDKLDAYKKLDHKIKGETEDVEVEKQEGADVTTQPRKRGRPPKHVTEARRQAEAQAREELIKKEAAKMVAQQHQPQTRASVPASRDEAARDAVMDIFMTGIETKVVEKVNAAGQDATLALQLELERIQADIKKHQEELSRLRGITITTDKKVTQIPGQAHFQFKELLDAISTGYPTMLVGPAGSGKTFAMRQVAQALDQEFYAISVGAQTSKSDLLGYMTATGELVSSTFRRAYESGGVFLCDEIDAGNANVLIVLNAALSSDICAFPDGMVEKHKDFYFGAAANTFGTGASRQYVGRNQIDAATLDRFINLNWEIDIALEAALVKDLTHGPKWHTIVQQLRKFAQERSYRVIISPRATQKGALLLERGFTLDKVIDMTITPTANEEQKQPLKECAKSLWRD